MQVHVINLDRSRQRLETFTRLNRACAEIVRFPAVDGRQVSRAVQVETGLIDADLSYPDPILGSAISHISLWQKAADQTEPLTIAEDDAILAPNFAAEASRLMRAFDWDVILWGWNFDAFMWTEIPNGVSRTRMQFNQDDLRANIETYRRDAVLATLIPLRHAFGIMTYSLTPAGARRLIDICLPLRNELISFEGCDVRVHNHTIDAAMNKAYPALKSFAAFPPLAVSENDASTSINQGKSSA